MTKLTQEIAHQVDLTEELDPPREPPQAAAPKLQTYCAECGGGWNNRRHDPEGDPLLGHHPFQYARLSDEAGT